MSKLKCAFDTWLVGTSLLDLYSHWRSVPGSSGQEPLGELVLVQEVRDSNRKLSPEKLRLLRDFLDDDHAAAALRLFPQVEVAEIRTRVASSVQALSSTALAAVLWSNDSSNPESAKRLAEAAAHYHSLWPLTQIPWGTRSDTPFRFALRSQRCWNSLLADESFGKVFESASGHKSMSVTTALILQHLLAVLFQESALLQSRGYITRNELQILYEQSDYNSPQNNYRGAVGSAAVTATICEEAGLYPDPVTMGILPVDTDMIESLQLGWRCCDPAPRRSVVSFSLNVPVNTLVVSGDSAGGLLACGLKATFYGRRLDVRRTSTCGLRLKSTAPTSGVLLSSDVELVGVGGVASKIQVFRDNKNITDCVLEENQAAAWDLEHFGSPRIWGASTLEELERALTADEKFEVLLERSCVKIVESWDACCRAADVADPNNMYLLDLHRRHRFDCYVDPWYRVWPVGIEPGKVGRPPKISLADMLNVLFQEANEVRGLSSRRIVVCDTAGAGKTVFTFRLMKVLASIDTWRQYHRGRPPMIVRVDGAWPRRDEIRLEFKAFLTSRLCDQLEISSDAETQVELVRECVEYAIKLKRIVLLIDGFDQFVRDDQDFVNDLVNSEDGRDQHWIITCRIHAIEAYASDGRVFDQRSCLRVNIEPFDQKQQDEYFLHPAAVGSICHENRVDLSSRWLRLIGITDRDAEDQHWNDEIRTRFDHLLQLPVNLKHLRDILENEEDSSRLPVFRTLSELALLSMRNTLQRALTTGERAIAERLKAEGLEACRALPRADQIKLLDRVLSLAAFQMMIEERYNGDVYGADVARFRERCWNRFMAAMDSNVPRSDTLLRHFNYAWSVLTVIELNHRNVTERFSDEAIAFRSRKVMESYAARYLTRYATNSDILGPEFDGIHDWIRHVEDLDNTSAYDFSNDPQWYDCWQMAIEMPRSSDWHRHDRATDLCMNPLVTATSLSVLFRRQKFGPRPTELIYRAWSLFEIDEQMLQEQTFLQTVGDELVRGASLPKEDLLAVGRKHLLPGAESVMQDFRENNRRCIEQLKRSTDACEQRHSQCHRTLHENAHSTWLAECRAQDASEKGLTLVTCPPLCNNSFVGIMGDNEMVIGDIRIQHELRVERFEILATQVTPLLYREFDGGFAQADTLQVAWAKEFRNDMKAMASQCRKSPWGAVPNDADEADAMQAVLPIVLVSWFDAWVFTRWLGQEYRLPTECQWEYACRASTISTYFFGNSLNGNQANCDGRLPYSESQEERTEQRSFDTSPDGPSIGVYYGCTSVVGYKGFPVNDFCVFDMHGNIREWCQDWFVGNWYQTRKVGSDGICGEDCGPPFGTSRVVRGGSWNDGAADCRAAVRHHLTPESRDLKTGFRFVRLNSLEAKSTNIDCGQ